MRPTYSSLCVRCARPKAELVGALTGLGLPPLPSAVHFFLVPRRRGSAFAGLCCGTDTGARLRLVWPAAYVRIATRRPEENARLLAAISADLTADLTGLKDLTGLACPGRQAGGDL